MSQVPQVQFKRAARSVMDVVNSLMSHRDVRKANLHCPTDEKGLVRYFVWCIEKCHAKDAKGKPLCDEWIVGYHIDPETLYYSRLAETVPPPADWEGVPLQWFDEVSCPSFGKAKQWRTELVEWGEIGI